MYTIGRNAMSPPQLPRYAPITAMYKKAKFKNVYNAIVGFDSDQSEHSSGLKLMF